jgi:hypothetical protein
VAERCVWWVEFPAECPGSWLGNWWGDGSSDTVDEARLRKRAATAYGLLKHAMESGLVGIRKELEHTRRGAKALRGYVDAAGGQSGKLLSSV